MRVSTLAAYRDSSLLAYAVRSLGCRPQYWLKLATWSLASRLCALRGTGIRGDKLALGAGDFSIAMLVGTERSGLVMCRGDARKQL